MKPFSLLRSLLGLAALLALTAAARAAEPAPVVLQVVMVTDDQGDPAAAGKQAAEELLAALGGQPLRAVIVAESFEDRPAKEELLAGLKAVLPPERIFGLATYGSFVQAGCTDYDSVCLLGIAGAGVEVDAALVTEMGTAKLAPADDLPLIQEKLHAAGKSLAGKLPRSDRERLLVLLADAHSPKNRYLVEGAQQVFGKTFPITGGCANKNAGQTFVYYRGQLHQDAAAGLLLGGDFQVALSGRMANEEQAVIRTAGEAGAEALARASRKPLGVVAFNCAGRRGKLGRYEDELASLHAAIGDLPLFGCYCAGEIGPVEDPDRDPAALSGGSGWHVMVTVICQ